MDYEKKYKEALEKAQRFYNNSVAITKKGLEDIFPELMENEDERIRKALIRFHKSTIDVDGIKGEDIIAWLEKQGEHANFRNKIQIGDKVTRNKDGVLVNLSQLKRVAKKDEKQGEQKFAELSSEQKHTLRTNNVPYESSTDAHLWTRAIGFDGEPMKSKSCEQKSAWSEEDESMLQNILECLKNGWRKLPTDILKYESWLKSLRPHSQWKPNELQLECLDDAIKHYQSNGSRPVILIELLEELKKL